MHNRFRYFIQIILIIVTNNLQNKIVNIVDNAH